jgi:hypothetical protein
MIHYTNNKITNQHNQFYTSTAPGISLKSKQHFKKVVNVTKGSSNANVKDKLKITMCE